MPESKILIYIMRRDLRVADNPILHHLCANKDHEITHLLPVYVFPPNQIEVSGFIAEDGVKSPFPEARSEIAKFWRCGPHRAKFLGESVWDVKEGLEKAGSGLCIRVGKVGETVKELIEGVKDAKIAGVWMVGEEASEEKREERDVKKACEQVGARFKVWKDEKYLIDE